MRQRAKVMWVAAWLAAAGCFAQSGRAQTAPSEAGTTALRNWYNDPFFALSDALAECPQPLGPRTTKQEADDDAHYRVERGTTCWLAHKCSKPNSYLYDAPIAEAIRERMGAARLIAGTSLWITVQRRFVYAEGCVPAGFDAAALQQALEAVPDVEQVFVRVSRDPHGAPPYKTLAPPP